MSDISLRMDLLNAKIKITELEKGRDIRDLEQQAKGVEDFFKSHEPRISMGKSAIWEVDDVLVDEAIKALKEQVK